MRSHRHLLRSLWRRINGRQRDGGTSGQEPSLFEPLVRLGEILATSSVPDLADLPLELWPGYRDSASTEKGFGPPPRLPDDDQDELDALDKHC